MARLESATSESDQLAWKPQGVPFFWGPKAAMKKIEEALELNEAASAKLVYVALCRIASNEATSTFVKPIQYIAMLASVSRSTVERRLRDLERLKLVRVERFALKQPNHYTLLLPARSDTSHRRNVASPAEVKNRGVVTHLLEKERTREREKGSKDGSPDRAFSH